MDPAWRITLGSFEAVHDEVRFGIERDFSFYHPGGKHTNIRVDKDMLIRALIIGILVPSALLAHAPEHHLGPDRWWLDWSWPPLVVISLSVLSLLYGIGIWNVRKGAVRKTHGARSMCFAAGIAFLLIALVSPLDVYSEVLASVHMVQHTVLMMVAAPLFVLGTPGPVLFQALPLKLRRKLGGVRRGVSRATRWLAVARPFLAWALYAVTLWLWHVPVMYEAALKNQWVHDLQHISFFVTAAIFWWILFHPSSRVRMDYGAGIIYLFVASLHSTALGALMAISPRLWYPHYSTTSQAFGLNAVDDQQLAGYIMWMPAGVSYVVAAAYLLWLWLGREEAQVPHRANLGAPNEGPKRDTGPRATPTG
jgi:cytochrome c oxidase assembly factor CtaG